jgi:hypothetical protein
MRMRLWCVIVLLVALCACQRGGSSSGGHDPARQQQILADCKQALDAPLSTDARPRAADDLPEQLSSEFRAVCECRAVAEDSEVPCSWLDQAGLHNCRARWMFFHEARKAGASDWPAILAAGLREDTRADPNFPEAIAKQLEDAVRLQHPDDCPKEPADLFAPCTALATGDAKRCPSDSDDCRELAGRLALLREGGLKRLAESGTPRDRRDAQAALGEPGICEPVFDAFIKRCESADH